ncbi:hypothetical protein ACFW9F_01215 [Streptomyces sp. NPDC059506]|uniref:hypothetical protein n=1 Tax=Streptomyces sp. NPDC059506 TaxID=3347751 RepID=UPI0036C33E99
MRASRPLGLVALSLALTGLLGAGTAVAAGQGDPDRHHRYIDAEECIDDGGQVVLEEEAEFGICNGGDSNGEIVDLDNDDDYDDDYFDDDFRPFDDKGAAKAKGQAKA